MSAGVPDPIRRTTTPQEAGRSCPYCRFPLKSGVEVVECGVCHAAHHGDCWSDNGGCAIMGCKGAAAGDAAPAAASPPQPPPSSSVLPGVGAPPPRTQVVPSQPPPPRVPPPAGGGSGRGNLGLIIALVVLALAIGGGAIAVVASSGKDSDEAASSEVVTDESAPVDDTTTTDETTVPDETTTDETPIEDTETDEEPPPDDGMNGKLPDVSEAEMEDEIRSVVLAFHRALVRGDYRGAWVLTSTRYRAKKERDIGYAEWARGQKTLGDHLDPEGLQIEIRDADPRNGVATVDATGMRYFAGRCPRWEGVTWAAYENGHWRYEPGYSISDQRRAEWEPKRDLTMGWGC